MIPCVSESFSGSFQIYAAFFSSCVAQSVTSEPFTIFNPCESIPAYNPVEFNTAPSTVTVPLVTTPKPPVALIIRFALPATVRFLLTLMPS